MAVEWYDTAQEQARETMHSRMVLYSETHRAQPSNSYIAGVDPITKQWKGNSICTTIMYIVNIEYKYNPRQSHTPLDPTTPMPVNDSQIQMHNTYYQPTSDLEFQL